MSTTKLRELTPTEITSIVDYAVSDFPRGSRPKAVEDYIIERAKYDFREQLKIKVAPSIIPELKERIKENFMTSLALPGQMVGTIAASSMGGPLTQATLNTFHQTGVSTGHQSKARGAGHITKLVGASKTISRVCTVYFKKKPKDIKEVLKNGSKIKGFKLQDLVSEFSIRNAVKNPTETLYGLVNEENDVWYPSWYNLHETYTGKSPWKNSRFCLSIMCDVQKLVVNKITLDDIAERITDNWGDAYCVPSPLNQGIIDIFFDEKSITLSNDDRGVLTNNNKVPWYIADTVIPEIKKTDICGISSVSDIAPYKTKDNEWTIQTVKGTLRDLFKLDDIDFRKTLSNDMWDIYETLGIEATRAFIINEFVELISDNGDTIDPRHIQLLVDQMTFRGTVDAASRNGIDRDRMPLAKASFEEPLRNFVRAAAMGEDDKITGVSAAVMVGALGKFGTGLNDVFVDIDMMKCSAPPHHPPSQCIPRNIPRNIPSSRSIQHPKAPLLKSLKPLSKAPLDDGFDLNPIDSVGFIPGYNSFDDDDDVDLYVGSP